MHQNPAPCTGLEFFSAAFLIGETREPVFLSPALCTIASNCEPLTGEVHMSRARRPDSLVGAALAAERIGNAPLRRYITKRLRELHGIELRFVRKQAGTQKPVKPSRESEVAHA